MNRESYLLWKDNAVTKAFMREMKEGLDSHINNEVWGKTVEEIGINAIIRKAKIQELQKVINWKIEDEENES